MDLDGTWGTEVEIMTIAHLLNTSIFVYNTEVANWWRFGPDMVDEALHFDITAMSMFIRNAYHHFEVVRSTFSSS